MPHIKEERKYDIKQNNRVTGVLFDPGGRMVDPGDLVYFVAVELCRRWREQPKFKTWFYMLQDYYMLKQMVLEKFPEVGMQEAEDALISSLFDFYHVVVTQYERLKAEENGNVYMQEGVLKPDGTLV